MTSFRILPKRPGYCIEMIKSSGARTIVWKTETEAEAFAIVRDLERMATAAERNSDRRAATLFGRRR